MIVLALILVIVVVWWYRIYRRRSDGTETVAARPLTPITEGDEVEDVDVEAPETEAKEMEMETIDLDVDAVPMFTPLAGLRKQKLRQ